MARISAFWALSFVPLSVAYAPSAFADGTRPLRPMVHIDRFGRTLEDVCPENKVGGRRCFSERIVPAGQKPRSRPGRTPFGGGSACSSEGGGGGSAPPAGTLSPSDILARYKIPASSSAAGKIVALAELPSTHAMADVNAYRAQFGIPTLPACPTNGAGVPTPGGKACFARVGPDGTVNTVGTTDCAGWSGETGLDMDMVSAACPDCSIVVMEATSEDTLDPLNTTAATVLHASAVSNSWGGPETGEDDPSPYSSSGILTVAASGDEGYLNEGEGAEAANFPASSIYVLAVGGTTLQKSGSAYSEIVWNDGSQGGAGGSGCSQEFAMPSWQKSSGFSFGSCTERASVDVSAAAEFSSDEEGGGIAAYDADDGGWNAVVGTSAASPLVAAIMVRLGLGDADQHATFYEHIADFNDVTSGDNGSCGGVMCTAGAGWDGPTGLGTPNGTLLSSLAGATPTPPPATADAGSGTTGGGGGTPPSGGGGGSKTSGGGGSTVGDATDGGSSSGSGGAGAPGGLGGTCTGPSDCNSNLCVSPGSGAGGVCSQSCEETSCPSGFACTSGYCFASGGATGDGFGSDGGSGASGCSSAPSSSSPVGGTAWVTLGVLAVFGRRYRRLRSSDPRVPGRDGSFG